MHSWTVKDVPGRKGPDPLSLSGVISVSVAGLAAGACLWRFAGYRTLFWLQLAGFVGQAAAAAAGSYMGCFSNFFEVLFVLSVLLVDTRFLNPGRAALAASGAGQADGRQALLGPSGSNVSPQDYAAIRA